MDDLRARGAVFSSGPDDHGYGVVAMVEVPGAGDVQLYQPRHQTGARALTRSGTTLSACDGSGAVAPPAGVDGGLSASFAGRPRGQDRQAAAYTASLTSRAAPMTPASRPSSLSTTGRFPVASGSDCR